MEKRLGKCLFLFLILIFLTVQVDATFICGQVEDSDDNFSAQWNEVELYYPEDPNNFVECEVSPDQNKYCCDARDIPGKKWKVGYEVYGRILDFENGYAAGPVSIISSGEGYTVLPKMKLGKVIDVESPSGKLFFSNNTNLFFNVSFKYPYNFVEIEKEDREVLCTNCLTFAEDLDLEFGVNRFKLVASHLGKSFFENVALTILESFSFDRNLECDTCGENSVRREKAVNMNLIVNLSHEVEGLELKEYVPISWEIISSDGVVSRHSETHNVIRFNVSGKNILKNYSVKSPRVRFFPRKYVFRTELEDELLKEDKVTVRWFFPFFGFDQNVVFNGIIRSTYSAARPNHPIVIRPRNSDFRRIGIFPNKFKRNVKFNLRELSLPEFDHSIKAYIFDTSLEEKEIEKIFVDFRISKKLIDEEKYENILFYILKDSWEEADIESYREDSRYFYYKGYVDPNYGVAIAGEKEGFMESLGF